MYKIEKDIEIPYARRYGYESYPFADMQVGDSFFVPSNKPSSRITSAAFFNAKKLGVMFTTRRIMEDGKMIGTRCWRVK